MKKWYYTWHLHLNSISIYETSDYDGKDGYDSKEEVIVAARNFLIEKQRDITLNLMIKGNEIAIMASNAEAVGRALSKLKNS